MTAIVNRVKLHRVVYTGEDDEVQLVLQERSGGAWVSQSYDGRVFVREVIDDDGTVLASVEGVFVENEDGGYVSFVLTADVIAALLPEGQEARDLRHGIHEVLESGNRPVTGPDALLLRRQSQSV